MAEAMKRKYVDDSSDVKRFLVVIGLELSLKGHVDEKKAQYIDSRLTGPAMEVYLRLSDADRKIFEKIKEELYKEFLKGQLNREEAIVVLGNRN